MQKTEKIGIIVKMRCSLFFAVANFSPFQGLVEILNAAAIDHVVASSKLKLPLVTERDYQRFIESEAPDYPKVGYQNHLTLQGLWEMGIVTVRNRCGQVEFHFTV